MQRTKLLSRKIDLELQVGRGITLIWAAWVKKGGGVGGARFLSIAHKLSEQPCIPVRAYSKSTNKIQFEISIINSRLTAKIYVGPRQDIQMHGTVILPVQTSTLLLSVKPHLNNFTPSFEAAAAAVRSRVHCVCALCGVAARAASSFGSSMHPL